MNFVCWACLVSIGGLFGWKYSSRSGMGTLPVTAYFLACLALAWLIGKVPRRFLRRPWIGIGAYCLAAVPSFLRVDPLALQVDRWSALGNFLGAIPRGEYPYGKLSHLGHLISGFPMLFVLAAPFYFLGDVGWLQFAALAAFAFLARKVGGGPEAAALAILLLFAQPGFHYEVLARSDLFSNMTVAAWCLYGSYRREQDPKAAQSLREAGLWGALLATRGITAIPFLLRAGSLFRSQGLMKVFAFGLVSGLVAIATFIPFYLWDADAFRLHNPLRVQAGYAPLAYFLPAAGGALYLGYSDPAGERRFRSAGLLILSLVSACFLRAAVLQGWRNAFTGSGFDITYFTLPVPFLILALAESGALETALRPAQPQKP